MLCDLRGRRVKPDLEVASEHRERRLCLQELKVAAQAEARAGSEGEEPLRSVIQTIAAAVLVPGEPAETPT